MGKDRHQHQSRLKIEDDFVELERRREIKIGAEECLPSMLLCPRKCIPPIPVFLQRGVTGSSFSFYAFERAKVCMDAMQNKPFKLFERDGFHTRAGGNKAYPDLGRRLSGKKKEEGGPIEFQFSIEFQGQDASRVHKACLEKEKKLIAKHSIKAINSKYLI